MIPTPKFKKDVQKLELIQQRATKMVQRSEDITYNKLRELDLFYLVKRRPQGE